MTIDSKGFNFRLLKALAKVGARPRTVVHYVAPSVWAYKKSSSGVKDFLADNLDLLLVLFPFEVAHFGRHLKTACVGPSILELSSVRAQLARHDQSPPRGDDVEADQPRSRPSRLLILPGSRAQEVHSHLPIMLSALKILSPSSHKDSGPTVEANVLALDVTLPHISPIVDAFTAVNPRLAVNIITVTRPCHSPPHACSLRSRKISHPTLEP